MRKSCCSLPFSWPATPTQCSSISATLNCLFCLHAFTSSCIYWDMFLLLFSWCFSLKRRICSVSQKPSRLLQVHTTKASFPSASYPSPPPVCLSIDCIALYILDLLHPLPLSPLRAGTGSYLCILPGTQTLRACLHKSRYLDVIVIAFANCCTCLVNRGEFWWLIVTHFGCLQVTFKGMEE